MKEEETQKKCKLILDHNPEWGGDGFYCQHCGVEFVPLSERQKLKKGKDIKKVWYDKGWDACIREFDWRIQEVSEKFRKDGWHITDIDKCRKFISDIEEIISKLR